MQYFTIEASEKLSLMLATTQLIVTFLFSMLFYQEWKKQKRSENEQYIPFALMLLYIFLFLGTAMTTYSNFFAGDVILNILENTRIYFILGVGLVAIVTGILIFIAERIIRRKSRHFFLIYFIGMVITLTILRLSNIPLFLGFNLILLIPLAILIVLFLHALLWKTPGKIRKKMILVILGFGLFIMAIFQEIWFILQNEFEIVFYFKNLILLASILTGYGFYTIPSFTEFDWNEKIRHLYVLNTNGLCLFQQPFREGSVADEDLLGGSLVAVQSLMGEMIQSERSLEVIDHGDAKMIFERSQNAIAIMVADENLYVVHHKLKQLLKEFEVLFGPTMNVWQGNLNHFYPLRPVVARIFELKPD